ncbi:MAG: hypothetical protein IPG56_10310 [Caulobacteraceae bacterium]|nr:hypothetical protein [Caulobacteraceae bacterium]
MQRSNFSLRGFGCRARVTRSISAAIKITAKLCALIDLLAERVGVREDRGSQMINITEA